MTPPNETLMQETALRYAKDALAEQHVANMIALEESDNPLALLEEIRKGIVYQEKEEAGQSYPVYMNNAIEDHPDGKAALRALAEKELESHHMQEIDSVRERYDHEQQSLYELHQQGGCSKETLESELQMAKILHEDEITILSRLHQHERESFESSQNPLDDTRAVIKDTKHYERFDDYVDERIDVAKTVLDINQQRQSEALLAEQSHDIENAPEIPGLLSETNSKDIDRNDWPMEWLGEATENTIEVEDHSVDQAAFDAHPQHITYEPALEEHSAPDIEYHSLGDVGASHDPIRWQGQPHDNDMDHEL